jgi:di/tricarboxylate transporter
MVINSAALSVVFLTIVEKFGFLDNIIDSVVFVLDRDLGWITQAIGFVVAAAVTGVIGNVAHQILMKSLPRSDK